MAKSEVFEIENISDLAVVIQFLVVYLKPNTVFLLDGPMASGKTTLVSELLKKIGVNGVHSPTYSLHHTYNSDLFKVHHFDLHRLISAEEIESSGFWDFFESNQDFFIVEWSKYIPVDQWPLNFKIVHITIDVLKNETRKYLIKFLN